MGTLMHNDTDFLSEATHEDFSDDNQTVQEPRLWQNNGWTARVINNDDDDGWAVAMYKDGESEPALVGPWTMGRDKKNPKPLDPPAFHTLVKTASEVLRRHEQQLHARHHKNVFIDHNATTFKITLDIIPDEENPSAQLSAYDTDGKQLAQFQVEPNFTLNRESAMRWVENDFLRPR